MDSDSANHHEMIQIWFSKDMYIIFTSIYNVLISIIATSYTWSNLVDTYYFKTQFHFIKIEIDKV